MKIPIACQLSEAEARSQVDEWRDLLAVAVVGAERVAPGQVALRLHDDLRQLDPLVRLARREKACCPFFDFELQIGAEAVALVIGVPDEAAGVLDAFVAAAGVA